MSDHEKNRGPKNLDQLIDEARRSLKPDQMGHKVDWENVDAKLFARLDAEAKRGIETSGVRKSGLPSVNRFGESPNRAMQVGGLLAIAAAFAIVMHRPATNTDATFDSDRVVQSSQGSQSPGETALMLTALQPGGDVHVDGEVAAAGRSLRALDTVETTTTHADFSPGNGSAAGAVAWRVEDHSRVTIRTLGGGGSPLIVDLAAGTVEAQVTPVERGEAFAVDLRGNANEIANGSHDVIRIAVHGTHLRVARDLSKNTASIDLSEGVVSIGFPPKVGSTYGKLVTAPAHIEIDVARFFAADGNDQAVTVDKNPASVRAPETPTARNAAATQIATAQDEEPTANEPADESHPLAPVPAANANDETHVQPHPVSIDARATETIRTAALACAAVHATSNEVRISVSSRLSLQVGADGIVQMARFEPPLSPEAQDCAGKTIYKTHFAPASAAHDVAIEVQVEP